MNIADYIKANPCPQRVVLLGKGPSLEDYRDEDFSGEFVVGCNEVAETYRCDMAFFIDDIMTGVEYPNSCLIARQKKLKESHGGRGLFWLWDGVPSWARRSTAAMAIYWLSQWGVTDFLLVGFDAYDGPCEKVYANGLRIKKERGRRISRNVARPVAGILHRDQSPGDFTSVNEIIANTLMFERLDPRWWHRGDRGFDGSARVRLETEEIYYGIYSEIVERKPEYGTTNHGAQYVGYVSRLFDNCATVVDVGGGRSGFGDLLSKLNPKIKTITVDVVDFSENCESTFIQSPAWDLSEINEDIDLITSFDMLEHLFLQDIEPTLSEWASRSRLGVLATIASYPATNRGGRGEILHPSVLKPAAWKSKLKKKWGHVMVREQSQGTIPRRRRKSGTYIATNRPENFPWPIAR